MSPTLTVGGLACGPLAVDALEVTGGRLLAVDAPSGAGSSLLLALLAGLVVPDAGEVRFDGRPIGPGWVHHRTLVEQDHRLAPELTAAETVSLPLRVAGRPKDEVAAATGRWLADLGLAGAAGQRVTQLSGGQQQRVALARAFAGARPVLLLDDPTAELDADNRSLVVRLLRGELAAGTRLAVAASHDPELLGVADAVVTIAGGRLARV